MPVALREGKHEDRSLEDNQKNIYAKRKRTQNENTLKYLNWANMFLKNQVKLRDNILYEQKLVLDRNQIDNDISYEGLKNIERVEASLKRSADDTLPVLNVNKAMANYGRINRPTYAAQENRFSRRNSGSNSMSQPRLSPAFGARVGYQASRNKCRILLDIDYGGNSPGTGQRKVGSGYQRKGAELPDYLKDRVQVNQASIPKRPIIKSAYEDRTLSYNRKLHNAIYQRNQLVSSSRSPSRRPTYQQQAQKRKIAVSPNVASQPTFQPPRKFVMDISKSPYVQALKQDTPTKPYETPEPLRLLKQKMPGLNQ